MTLPPSGAVLIVGATSGAGKSTVSAGLCRLLHRRGGRVAPFKAQNMSNHSAVTADGGEVGRAQAMQALAAGVDIDRRMNPILLKPHSDRGSHLVVLGDDTRLVDAHNYGSVATTLKPMVMTAFNSLRDDYDWVIAEGAGGAAEINLLDRDLVNLPLARAVGMPAVLVVDIDRGGAFASAHGTIDLVPPELRDTIAGVVFNQFRGDPRLLEPGIADLEERDGIPVWGILPHLGTEPLLGVEDSLDISVGGGAVGRSARPIRVGVIRFPHLANPSDLDPLMIEPDVVVTWATHPDHLVDCDLVVVPGSRSTVADLAWMRSRGLDRAIIERASDPTGRIIGICAGYQMLGETIDDSVESNAGRVAGLGILPVATTFANPKIVHRSTGTAEGVPVWGYEIHHGRSVTTGQPWLTLDGVPEGAVSADGVVKATSLHGIFDSDEFRSALLAEVAEVADRSVAPSSVAFADAITAQHEALADWVEAHLDVDAVLAAGAAAAAVGQGPGW